VARGKGSDGRQRKKRTSKNTCGTPNRKPKTLIVQQSHSSAFRPTTLLPDDIILPGKGAGEEGGVQGAGGAEEGDIGSRGRKCWHMCSRMS